MDIGSEIGTKMRSAVKAKLLELGTGDTAGYIDDELPDYIMIMIANKRSKSQMVSDLELFLGSKTTHFVLWLHEVLQKLQEVTIPTPIVKPIVAKKSKTVDNKKAENKKEKKVKDGKKDKTKSNKSQAVSATSKIADFNSINDVVAEHLLEKAKKELDITSLNETHIKKVKEGSKHSNNVTANKTDNAAATSEITSSTDVSGSVATNSSQVISGNRDKDLAELADIQRRIYAAKKHLREIGELDEQLESEDEDFLNLKEDESSQDFDVEDDLSRKSLSKQASVEEDNEAATNKTSSNSLESQEKQTAEIEHQKNETVTAEKVSTREILPEKQTPVNDNKEPQKEIKASHEPQTKKRPVHERLGMRQQQREEEPEVSRTRRQRMEKELYVPAFRRQDKETERKSERGRERVREPERSRERSREPERSRGEREREHDARKRRVTNSPRYTSRQSTANRRRSSSSNSVDSYEREAQRHRIGSSVVIAANKPAPASESEEEKPVNSVIKIKPRAPVSPSKQASKNLLMRAMADAQRSTILTKSSSKKEVKSNRVKERLGEKPVRERLKRAATSTSRSDSGGMALFRRTTRNLIIEVDAAGKNRQKRGRYNNDVKQEEYATSPMSEHSESDGEHMYGSQAFKPRRLNAYETMKSNYEDSEEMCNEDEADEGMSVSKTQFVVTLNDEKSSAKYGSRNSHLRSRSNSPQPQVSSSSMARRDRSRQTHSNVKSRLSGKATSSSSISPHGGTVRMSERESNNSTPINTSPTLGHRVEVYRKPNEVKKIIIQNDSDDDEFSPKKQSESVERRTRKKSSTERETVQSQQRKRKLTPIKYRGEEHLNQHACEEANEPPPMKRSSGSVDKNERDEREREISQERSRKISIRNTEARKYDNIPALSSVALDSAAIKVIKPKQLCKFHPNCTKSFCEYYHPKAPCKTFPNCKYGDKCMYSHPNCKYDLACTNLNCNYQHSGPRNPSQLQPTAPPLSSHVVPVQNYKTISAINQVSLPVDTARGSTCKYFPNCTKVGCTFIHPKMCRYGKNCINPTCNYYHHDAPSSSKFKWVASLV